MTDEVAAWLPGILTVLVVVVAVPLNWYVTWLLWRVARADPEGVAIRAMVGFSACVAVIVTVFAVIFVNNGLNPPVLNSWQTMVLTRGVLLALSVVPALYWLRWYRSNGH